MRLRVCATSWRMCLWYLFTPSEVLQCSYCQEACDWEDEIKAAPHTLHNLYRLLLILLLLSPAPAKVETACWRTRCACVHCWQSNLSGEYVLILFMPSKYWFPALCMRIILDRWTCLRHCSFHLANESSAAEWYFKTKIQRTVRTKCIMLSKMQQ